jgi:hypothetical protein
VSDESSAQRSPAPEATWAAALLACGRGAALSHASAAALHGLLDVDSAVHVTVARCVDLAALGVRIDPALEKAVATRLVSLRTLRA